MDELEREVQRYLKAQSALGTTPTNAGDVKRTVLQAMVEERLVVQASTASGNKVDDARLDSVLQSIQLARGGDSGFQTWLVDNLFTPEGFRAAMQRQMLATMATDTVAAQVPASAEQVHARHVLVASSNLADTLLSNLAGGSDFAAAARSYSLDLDTRLNGGDLGWFARGTLIVPEVEAAAFALQPNQISQVVQSAEGFHIVQTLEHADSRPLSPAQLEILRRRAVRDWIAKLVEKANIQVFLP
jgi:parvulin-like peptidyl-prolyl isomerase